MCLVGPPFYPPRRQIGGLSVLVPLYHNILLNMFSLHPTETLPPLRLQRSFAYVRVPFFRLSMCLPSWFGLGTPKTWFLCWLPLPFLFYLDRECGWWPSTVGVVFFWFHFFPSCAFPPCVVFAGVRISTSPSCCACCEIVPPFFPLCGCTSPSDSRFKPLLLLVQPATARSKLPCQLMFSPFFQTHFVGPSQMP